MQKTKIEWVKNPDGSQGQSWNPIKGLCPVGCWYCYGKRIYYRFEWMLEGIGEIGYVAEWELEQPEKRKKPTGIFVCSTYELFHSPDKFARDETFKIIERCPQHRFYILTKFPQNIDRPMPHNVWLGITIEDDSENSELRLSYLYGNEHIRKDQLIFLSIEPMLGIPDIPHIEYFDWLIIGKLTGYGSKHDPERKDIEWLINNYKQSRKGKAPVFLKNNLKKIWGDSLIQEMPNV
jgi:protein gp37